MKDFLLKIREPRPPQPLRRQILISAAIALAGLLLGVGQKWLDGTAVNELPQLFQRLDLTNYFGRLAVWILLGTAISVYAPSPQRAAVNTCLFFFCMVSGYYVYCQLVLGFLPRSYMLLWLALAALSPLAAAVCWYAKGKGPAAIGISAVILGALFSQAFLFTQGFAVTHLTEVLTWAGALVILRRRPKEFALQLALSLPAALICQLLLPQF